MNLQQIAVRLLAVAAVMAVSLDVDAQRRPTEADQQVRIRNFFSTASRFRPPRPRPPQSRPPQSGPQQPGLPGNEGDNRENGDRFRTIDGSLNNLSAPLMGTAGVPYWRIAPAAYTNGFASPTRTRELSAREISNLVCDQTESIPNDRFLTDMVWQWGQFVDHDLDLTETASPTVAFPIVVPVGDIFFDPLGTGTQTISLFRSKYDKSSKIDTRNPRQQVNSITAWMDASNVYGSDEATMNSLRRFRRGQMLVSSGTLLPLDEDGFYMAGDERANEQAGLTAMHTLFVREHNRLAKLIYDRNNELSDERIFQVARREVIAIIQSITYNEFLPALLGRDTVPAYKGYRPGASANISNEFATAAYRFGHSMLSTELQRINRNGKTISSGPIALQDAFFNPALLQEHGIDPYLRGLCYQQAQEIDPYIIDDVRNFLFGPPGSGGFDLASLNIQRGREHGLPDYNTLRVATGRSPARGFEDITSDPQRQVALLLAYDNVNSIDPWIGMLAEDHVRGASMGRTALLILREQFKKIRDADRFWYQRDLRGGELRRIENTRLSSVIRRNTSIRNIQDNVFFMRSAQPDRLVAARPPRPQR